MKGDIWAQWQAWTAIYAALVATAVLGLEVRRWFESGVRLIVDAIPDASVSGSGADERYLVVTVSNRGDRSATITHFAVVDYGGRWERWWRCLLRRSKKNLLVPDPRINEAYPPVLPSVLQPGQQWQGVAKWYLLEAVEPDLAKGFFVAIYSSDRRRPRVHRVSVLGLSGSRTRVLEEEARGDFMD